MLRNRVVVQVFDPARFRRRRGIIRAMGSSGIFDHWSDCPRRANAHLRCTCSERGLEEDAADRMKARVAAERERDEARSRVTDLEILAEELMGERDKAERERNEGLAKPDTVGNVLGTVIVAGTLRPGETMRLEGDHAAIDAVRGLLARLARYEAPGSALLKAEHAEDCYVNFWARAGHKPLDEHAEERVCDCGRSMREQAYREQHARDVAIVEMVDLTQVSPVDNPNVSSRALVAIAKGAILRALKGEM